MSVAAERYEPRTHAATAHFPGGGPAGKTCAECRALMPTRRTGRGRCFVWLAFKGMGYRVSGLYRAEHKHSWSAGLPTIEAATLACKYFEGKT